MDGTWLIGQRGRGDDAHTFFGAEWSAHVTAGGPVEIMAVAEPTRVGEEMLDENPVEAVGKLGKVTANIVIESKLSVEDQQADAGRGELLGHRAHIKDRGGSQLRTPGRSSTKRTPRVDCSVQYHRHHDPRTSRVQITVARPIGLMSHSQVVGVAASSSNWWMRSVSTARLDAQNASALTSMPKRAARPAASDSPVEANRSS